jgi:hypothetical protein
MEQSTIEEMSWEEAEKICERYEDTKYFQFKSNINKDDIFEVESSEEFTKKFGIEITHFQKKSCLSRKGHKFWTYEALYKNQAGYVELQFKFWETKGPKKLRSPPGSHKETPVTDVLKATLIKLYGL